MNGKSLFDIGAGNWGLFNASEILNEGFNIKRIVLVDPFISEGLMYPVNPILKKTAQYKKIEFSNLDALSFLLKQQDNSGNVITVAIDRIIIPNDEYLKRMTEEIVRVIPPDGAYISCGSDTEDFAKRLFAKYDEYGGIFIFKK